MLRPDLEIQIQAYVESVPNLPALPTVVSELVAATNEERENFNQIARLVEKDIGLSGRILRIANSAFYARAGKVGTVSMAISRMGTEEFKMVVFSAAVMNTFRDLESRVDMRAFWRHCLASGLACHVLSDPTRVDEAASFGDNPYYMAGLLHHLGILVEILKDPEGFEEMRLESVQRGCPIVEIERRKTGFDHADIGAALLELWNFPDSICDAARYHLRPDEAMRNRKTVQVVHLSSLLCHELDPMGDSLVGVAPWFSERAFFELGWTLEQLPALKRSLFEYLRKAHEFGEAIMA
jgi:HD-like signal output (HDOD) protein